MPGGWSRRLGKQVHIESKPTPSSAAFGASISSMIRFGTDLSA